MDEIEATLTGVIDKFVSLQSWSQKHESDRRSAKVFPFVLSIDAGLKRLRTADKAHPLQDLVREVRTAFDTKEFRAILLAAFNWRSASKRASEAAKADSRKQVSSPAPKKKSHPVQKPRHTLHRQRSVPVARSIDPAQQARDAANCEKFVRDMVAFLDSIPADTMKRMRAPEEHVDIYRAGRRLYGSFGSSR